MEEILNNIENKEIFLKAIILGITYGKSNKANYYLENIEKELQKLNDKNNNKDNNKNIDKNNDKNNENIFILKYENNLLNLENQKKKTIDLIIFFNKKYSNNHPKINYLKNNLMLIDKEIIKYNFFLKKIKDDSENKNISLKTTNNIEKNLITDNIINNVLNNNLDSDSLINDNLEKKDNLVEELEKTLDNLSTLFIK